MATTTPSHDVPPSYDEVTAADSRQQVPRANPAPNMPPPNMVPPMYIQQQQPQTVIIQQAPGVYAPSSHVIVVHEIKVAPSFDPYPEICPYCNQTGLTRRHFVMGSMACLFLFLSIIFFPFIFFICCTSFQDAHHYCPSCARLIAIKRR